MDILSLKIECVYGCYLEQPVHKICETNGELTLEELCSFILDIFDFDDDHLHEFFVGKTFRNANRHLENEFLTLSDIFPLDKGQFLFMSFDFGDNWMFKIATTRKKAKYDPQATYPYVLEHVGQNPEQYPMYEEDH